MPGRLVAYVSKSSSNAISGILYLLFCIAYMRLAMDLDIWLWQQNDRDNGQITSFFRRFLRRISQFQGFEQVSMTS